MERTPAATNVPREFPRREGFSITPDPFEAGFEDEAYFWGRGSWGDPKIGSNTVEVGGQIVPLLSSLRLPWATVVWVGGLGGRGGG